MEVNFPVPILSRRMKLVGSKIIWFRQMILENLIPFPCKTLRSDIEYLDIVRDCRIL